MTLYALDLFCCAGGATAGLKRAGFHVTGIDINPQPNYVGHLFVQTDVLTLDVDFLREFDFIWASPPCQQFCAYRSRDPSKVGASYPNLIPQTRAALSLSGVPYAIENVPGAPLENPVTLCGSMFGLEVRRHRCFEANFEIAQPVCQHGQQQGDFPQTTNRKNRRKTCEIGVYRIPLAVQKRAIGGRPGELDRMTLHELSESIPPAYSEYVGREFHRTREVV